VLVGVPSEVLRPSIAKPDNNHILIRAIRDDDHKYLRLIAKLGLKF